VTDFAITLLRKIMLDAAREDRWQTMHEIGAKMRKEYGLTCTVVDIRAWLRTVSGDNQHILAARRREGAPIYEYLLFPRLRPQGGE